jgi:predicted RNA-binding Zn ribbon-like protein
VDEQALQGVLLAVELANEPPRDSPLRAAFEAADVEAFARVVNPLLEAPAMREGALVAARSELGLAAYGLAALVAEHGLGRLGICAADDCTAVYADTSPQGSRRYCSRTCSTRQNVRRHRRVST